MIVKPFEMPLDLLQMEALNRRIPENHPKKNDIVRDLLKKYAGISGERETYYQLQFVPKNKFYIFHNLRLPDGNNYFQPDFLLLSPSLIIILEVKNYKGLVYFNDIYQLIHIKENRTEETYDNPISQVERHALQLQNWLYQNGFFDFPILSFVVLSSGTRLKNFGTHNEDILKKIIPVSNLVKKINNLSTQYPDQNISPKELERCTKKLLKSHYPLNRDLLREYEINSNELTKGVQCNHCKSFNLIRNKRKWVCLECGMEGKNNHIQALNDYYLLVSDSIHNRQARDFLQIDSPDVSYKLLKNAGYKLVGKSAASKYVLEHKTIPLD